MDEREKGAVTAAAREKPGKGGNVFGSRNFRLVFFGALVSELGAGLYSFAVSFYILEISGNNAFLQGLYLALCGAMLLLFTPIGGVLGDRFNKAKIMFLCDYIKGASSSWPPCSCWCSRRRRRTSSFSSPWASWATP